jgi:hypothetical protein
MARSLNITLPFIPPGWIDQLHPLDQRVFGVLKAYARELWRKRYHDGGGAKTPRESSPKISWRRGNE